MTLVLAGGRVVTMDAKRSVLDPGVVMIEGGRISRVEPLADWTPAPNERVVRTDGRLVLPGFVNAHTHTNMTVLRGYADDIPLGAWLPIFEDMGDWLPAVEYEWSAALGCAELLLGGVTCIADRYGPLEPTAWPMQKSGIRAVVTSTLSDAAGDAGRRAALDLLSTLGTDPEQRVHGSLGPHATDTCSDDLLKWVAAEADRSGANIHMHVAQALEEVRTAQQRGYRDPADMLRQLGVLRPQLLAAHATRLTTSGIKDLAEFDVAVAHCPTSNARLEGAVASIGEMLSMGIRVGLGTDSAAANNTMDMMQEMKAATLLNQVRAADPAAFPADLALRLATIDSAKALGMDQLIGSLEPGKRADVTTLSTAHPAWSPIHEAASSIVYSGASRDVEDVIIDGQEVVRNGELLTMDIQELRERANSNRRLLPSR